MKLIESSLLNYYQKELSYLRKRGSEFAKKYPKIAGRLELGVDTSPDPHVERLIESFAFLTARIQSNLESEFPQLATSILGNVYPQLLNPVPSMTIAYFDTSKTKLPAVPLTIPKEHKLIAFTTDGEKCRFRTCYETDLWPLELTMAEFRYTNEFRYFRSMPDLPLIQLRLKAANEFPLQKANPGKLRFYIHGENRQANTIYELLFNELKHISVIADSNREVANSKNKLKINPVGFEENENVIPFPNNVNSAYRLLQEYFVFQEKFMFFEISGIPEINAEDHIDIFFVLNTHSRSELEIDNSNFVLGCTPIINLFNRLSDPIRIDQFSSEYRINPDSHREHITEINSILSVMPAGTNEQEVIEPYFSFKHHKEENKDTVYWFSRREKTKRPGLTGSDIYLSILDLNFDPASPPVKTLYAKLLCTNRHLASLMPQGTWLESEEKIAPFDITILRKPTHQINAPEGKELWRLISSFALNYLSLSSDKESLNALKEILTLYDFDNLVENRRQINGISSMQTKNIFWRIGKDNWRGFCRGIEVALEFDAENFAGNSEYLFASVLNRFFPLYTSINSFTRLKVKRKQDRGDTWKVWPPRLGTKELL